MADANISNVLTQDQQIRVELLKLAYRHDRSAGDIVKRADEMESYVSGTRGQVEPVTDRQAEPDSPI